MRTKSSILTVLFVVGMASVASAAITAYEAFDYTVGLEHLRDVSPWVAPTTQTPHDDFDVYEGSLYYSDGVNALQTSGNSAGRRDKAISPDTSNRSDVEAALGSATQALFTSTQTIYVSFLWQSGGGQVGFRDKNTGSGWTGGFTMITDMNYWGPGWKLSASDIDGTSETDGGSTETWDFTPARFFVIKIDNVVGGADTISVIYDPADLTTEPSWSAPDMQTTTKDIGAPDKLWLYTWPDTTYGNGNLHERTGLHIDEIRIGTSWDDVTPIVPNNPGDVNKDQFIGGYDITQVVHNWGMTGAIWTDGDVDGPGGVPDGLVGADDYTAVLTNWGTNYATEPPGEAVPEPATLALLIIGGLSLIRRR